MSGASLLSNRLDALSPAKRALLEQRLNGNRRSALSALPRALRPAEIPLSYAQQRLWVLHQLAPDSPAYHVPLTLRFQAPIDADALDRALIEVVRAHEVLRTRFLTDAEANPFQVIDPPPPGNLVHVSDWTGLALPPETLEHDLQQAILEESTRPFNLSTGPLLRAHVFLLGLRESVLLLVAHHIVTDGWSNDVLLRSIRLLYAAFSRGRPLHLPELPIQYADYAIWQRDPAQEIRFASHLDFWRERLAGLHPLPIPFDVPHPGNNKRGDRFEMCLESREIEQLQAACIEHKLTLFMALVASFQIVLAHWTGTGDIAVGTPVANRDRSEIEELIGFFVNTLVIRSRVDLKLRLSDFLQTVRSTCLDAYAHQEIPFELLVDKLNPLRNLDRSPFFQVSLSLQTKPSQSTSSLMSGLEYARPVFTAAKFDLSLDCHWHAGALIGVWTYAADRFHPPTVKALSLQLSHVLSQFNSSTDLSLEALLSSVGADPAPGLTPIRSWSQGESRTWPECGSVVDLFEQTAARYGDRIAVEASGASVTYAELNARAGRLASRLRARGVGPERIVAIFEPRGVAMVVALLAVWKAGGAYLPLDGSWPHDRVNGLLDQSRATAVLAHPAWMDRLEPRWQAQCVEPGSAESAEADPAPPPGPAPPTAAVAAENLAYILYTSGSTGQPKGVMVSHAALRHYVRYAAETYGLQASSAPSLVASPLCFDLTVTSLIVPLCIGSRVRLLGEGSELDELAAAVQSGTWGLVKITPSHLRALSAQLGVPPHPGRPVPDSKGVWVVGGEALDASLLTGLPGSRVVNEYGPTEATVGCSIYEVPLDQPQSPALPTSVPIGRPIANTRIYVLDPGFGLLPPASEGDLYIAGPGLARGYVNHPEWTADRFIPDPYGEPGERMYRTGDRARWRADGNLEYLGRIDDQVKVRGYRIELGEIEAALRRLPGVTAAAVAVHPAPDGTLELTAYVTGLQAQHNTILPRRLPAAEAEPLTTALARTLPSYMLPQTFLHLPQIPLNTNGKINRTALPMPERVAHGPVVPPRNSTEVQVLTIWQTVLKRSDFGVEEDFFAAGGNSIAAIRILAKVNQTFAIELPAISLFQTRTVRSLADRIQQAFQRVDILVPFTRNGTQTPLFCIHPAWGEVFCFRQLAAHLGQDQALYALQDPALHEQTNPVSIEAMASRYLDEIRTVQPNGPYHLAGYSFGGLVAFEMARQLAEQREKADLLAILDTPAPCFHAQFAAQATLPLLLESLAVQLDLPFVAGDLAKLSPSDLVAHVTGHVGKLDIASGMDSTWMMRRWNLFTSRLELGGRYQPGIYPGRVTLLRTTDPSPRLRGTLLDWHVASRVDEDLGWGDYTTQPVRTIRVPGFHDQLLDEPYVQEVALSLQHCLQSESPHP